MDEYIEREGIKKSIKFFFDIRLKLTHPPIEIKQLVLDVIDGERAADVQPVRHGRWIETHISLCKWIPEDEKEEGHSFYMAEMKCSCCERYNTKTFSLTLEKPDFCQHCGARMGGGSDE